MGRATTWICLAVVLAAGLWFGASAMTIVRERAAFEDARIMFPIAHDWFAGSGTLYPPSVRAQRVPGVPSYRYPPLWATAVAVLQALVTERTGILIWAAVSLVVFFAGVVVVMRHVGLRVLSPWGAGFVALLALFAPLYETFNGPTKELMMVGLMGLAFVLADRGRDDQAGLAFAGAIVLKVYPVLFGLWALVRRRFALLAWTAGWFVVLNVLPLPLIGWRDTWTFYTRILPFQGGSSPSAENAGIELLLMGREWLRWFDSGVAPLDRGQFAAAPALVWRLAVLAGWLGLAWWLHRRDALRTPAARLALFGAWAASILVVIPVAWVNYQLWLVFPILAAFAWLREARPRGPWLAVGALWAVTLVGLVTPTGRWLMTTMWKPDPVRAFVLTSSVGEWARAEFRERVARRESMLDREGAAALADRPAAARREWLARRGVPGAGDPATDLEGARERLAALRSAGAVEPLERRRAETEVRMAALSTRSVVRLMTLRAVVGVAAFVASLGVALAWGARRRRPQRGTAAAGT